MHRVPKPQDQARLLKAHLKSLGIELKHQDALEAVARSQGYVGWKAMAAAPLATGTPRSRQTHAPGDLDKVQEPKGPPTVVGDADGQWYDILVAVDASMSARVRVKAHTSEDAEMLARRFGADHWPTHFAVDEASCRKASDFYVASIEALDDEANG